MGTRGIKANEGNWMRKGTRSGQKSPLSSCNLFFNTETTPRWVPLVVKGILAARGRSVTLKKEECDHYVFSVTPKTSSNKDSNVGN